jgi:hypothetical protein
MIWTIITAIATVFSMLAYILTALYIRAELKHLEKDRYLAVTNQLFTIWQSEEFMTAQLWLLHQLEETTWADFVRKHRGDVGEAAFHRIGSFYDRIGTLTRLEMIDEKEILSTVGAYAIAVWQKIEPLVKEARSLENSVLFDDFEKLLPACYECYVPALHGNPALQLQVRPFSLEQRIVPPPGKSTGPKDPPGASGASRTSTPSVSQPIQKKAVDGEHARIQRSELKRLLDRKTPLSLLDVRFPTQVAEHPEKLPGALWIQADQISARYQELPLDREVIVYCA